ncbi:uncharacterized protein LOC122499991 [Leptopilina heterotoma]|uniref:uncharacterized protein LOC122499991 n=1 Tax=Leptopilina heterotoma TaxID=63436 RepID=UPI001CA92E3A|nr:uncharacterized protein LOC122499991 [Leptopilina heterotoma]
MASSENSDFRMDFSDETEEQRAARNLLYYQQQSSKNVRSRTNSTSSLDSDKKRKCENQPDPFKPPLDPNTVRADQSGKKTGKKEVKLVKYENSNKGNCPVFLQRDPKSNDASKDLNHVSVGKIIHNLYPGKVVGIYPSGRGKVRVIMNGGRAANQIVSDPTLKSKGLIAIIPSSFVTCQGIINNIGLDISTEEILENAEIIGNYGKDCKIINALRFNRRKIDEKNTVTFEPSTTVLLTFQGTTIPERVSIYKGSSPVRPYIPDPRMCMNCLRFGHIAKHCRSKTRCQQCGGSAPHNDDTNPCTNASGPPRCANCNGPHNLRQNNVQSSRFKKKFATTQLNIKCPLTKQRKSSNQKETLVAWTLLTSPTFLIWQINLPLLQPSHKILTSKNVYSLKRQQFTTTILNRQQTKHHTLTQTEHQKTLLLQPSSLQTGTMADPRSPCLTVLLFRILHLPLLLLPRLNHTHLTLTPRS